MYYDYWYFFHQVIVLSTSSVSVRFFGRAISFLLLKLFECIVQDVISCNHFMQLVTHVNFLCVSKTYFFLRE